jgi:hypothetical protein
MQERLASSDAQLKRAVQDLNLEQERRRVSDEGDMVTLIMRMRLTRRERRPGCGISCDVHHERRDSRTS